MRNTPSARVRRLSLLFAIPALVLATLASVSAHMIKGLFHGATAFVSSPSAGSDLPIPIAWGSDTGLRVACFFVANTTPARADAPAWPRVTAVGFELPGVLSGFSLISPLDEGWDLMEGVPVVVPGHGAMTIDFALVAPVNPVGRALRGHPHRLLGIPPGQLPARGNGTRFCVSGPFPDKPATSTSPAAPYTIEELINGVVVRFQGVESHGPSLDLGVWDNALRTIPLYP